MTLTHIAEQIAHLHESGGSFGSVQAALETLIKAAEEADFELVQLREALRLLRGGSPKEPETTLGCNFVTGSERGESNAFYLPEGAIPPPVLPETPGEEARPESD